MFLGGWRFADLGNHEFEGVAVAFVQLLAGQAQVGISSLFGRAPAGELFPDGLKGFYGFWAFFFLSGLSHGKVELGVGAQGGDERGLLGIPFFPLVII